MFADVSVIIPYYNAAGTIARSIHSVIAQTLPVKKLVVVNDGCDCDVLRHLLEAFRGRIELELVDLGVNYGAAYARNVGVAKATTSFVAFLDADDVWHPEKIARQYKVMEESEAFLSCHRYEANLDKRKFPVNQAITYQELKAQGFIFGNPIFTPTVMVRRAGLVEFDDRLSRSEDLKCWVENLRNGRFLRMDAVLAGGFKRPVGESGLSGSFEKMHSEYKRAWTFLWEERTVGKGMYLFAMAIENIKYPLRVLLGRLFHS